MAKPLKLHFISDYEDFEPFILDAADPSFPVSWLMSEVMRRAIDEEDGHCLIRFTCCSELMSQCMCAGGAPVVELRCMRTQGPLPVCICPVPLKVAFA